MAMLLMNQLNYDVCDMINKVVMKDHKRQKIIDDYEIFINGIDDIDDIDDYFYNLHLHIFYKNKCGRFTGSDKDDMFKKFQNVKDYMNLNIDDNILSVKLSISTGFVDCDGIYYSADSCSSEAKIIDSYKVPAELMAGIKRWWDEDIFDEDEFITQYNEVKELYDNDELEFYDNDKYGLNTIIFNKW